MTYTTELVVPTHHTLLGVEVTNATDHPQGVVAYYGTVSKNIEYLNLISCQA